MFHVFQAQEAYLTDSGVVFAPEWDGDWLTVADGPDGERIALPVELEAVDEGKVEHYQAWGILTESSGESYSATLKIKHDLVTGDLSSKLVIEVPTESPGDDRYIDRPQSLGAGDSFAFNTLTVNMISGEQIYYDYPIITFRSSPVFAFSQPDNQVQVVISATNIGGKVGFTPLQ